MNSKDLEKLSSKLDLNSLAAELNHGQPVSVQRPRAMTTLKLQWLAERLRKTERIKKQLAAGTYSVDSKSVAKAILGYDLVSESKPKNEVN